MKIYCQICECLAGDIKEGSKLLKGLVYICKNCAIDEGILNKQYNNYDTTSCPNSAGLDELKKIFGMA